MSYSTESLTITMPIVPASQRVAKQFACEQPNQIKAEQVYRNTLAVQLVRDYLEMLGITTALADGLCWNPVGRLCADVADLPIPDFGCLECRPVQPQQVTCEIPPEVWSDRIGYVIVQLDEANRQGTLLGFVPTVEQSELALEHLQSLDYLLVHLATLAVDPAPVATSVPIPEPVRTMPPVVESSDAVPTVIQLQRWLHQVFDQGWQSIEQILGEDPQQFANASRMAIAFRTQQTFMSPSQIRTLIDQVYSSTDDHQQKTAAFELGDIGSCNPDACQALMHLVQTTQDEETRWIAAESLWILDPTNPASGIRRVTDLGMRLGRHAVALMVAVLRKTNGHLAVLLRVYPMDNRTLPMGLTLTVLDEAGDRFLEAQARKLDNYIQLKFSGEPGERFSVRVYLEDVAIVENFVI